MSMILDVIVIATLLICVIVYTKRGFIKGILGLCGCFVHAGASFHIIKNF